MAKSVKVGLIGSGSISYTYLNNLTKTFSITDVVGCSDLIPDRSASRAEEFGIRQMTNEEIFSDPEIEIVVNTTYPMSHYKISKQAMEAGKHVYAEKMMATNFENAKELYDISKREGVRLAQAPDTFLGGGLQTARKLLDAGMIGKPFGAQAMCIRGYRLTGEERQDPLPFCFTDGGNIPYDMGGYYIHALVNMLGPVKRVGGFSRAFEPKEIYRNPRHPDYKGGIDLDVSTIMTGSLEFWNGCYANLTTMGVSHLNEIPRLEIYGTEGTLILPDPNTFCGPVILMRGTRDENLQTCEMPLTHGYGYKNPEDPQATEEANKWKDSYRGIGVADLAWAIRNGRPHRCSAELGLHAMEIIHGIERSCAENKLYEMTTKPERPEAIPTGFIYDTASEACLDT